MNMTQVVQQQFSELQNERSYLKEMDHIPAKELKAVETIKNSKFYTHIGMCTGCLIKLTRKEMEKNRGEFELIEKM